MLEANPAIIEELKTFVGLVKGDPALLKAFSTSETSFTRNRKLPFERVVLTIAKLCKKTLSVELESLFEELSVPSPCTVSAFSQQRMKLRPLFFEAWNQLLVDSFYHYYGTAVKRWEGYRVIAADGSNISLVDTPALNSHFGGQGNQHGGFVQAKSFHCYDVLNDLLMFSRIQPYRCAELPLAYETVARFDSDMLVVYDRNFCNYKMVALHLWQEREIKFVIRGNENQHMVRDFVASGAASSTVDMKATESSVRELKKCGYRTDRKTLLKVRLVRVDLGKSVEVLLTNLWEEDGHTAGVFRDLYHKRWGIETSFALQKNILRLESFSGLSVQSVEQDFFATVFAANLHALLIKQAQAELDGVQRTYPLKVNRNKSYGRLHGFIVELFVSLDPRQILQKLDGYFTRDPVPYRKGRTFPRVTKNRQSKSKHKTFMNYKPAF